VSFPKKTPYGVDFAEIKRALREHYVILRFSAPDHGESVTFWLDKGDVQFHSPRPKNPFAGRVLHKIRKIR
jgi:hypothetical protein